MLVSCSRRSHVALHNPCMKVNAYATLLAALFISQQS